MVRRAPVPYRPTLLALSSVLALALPAAPVLAAPSAAELMALLAAGLDEEVVAAEGDCGDVLALRAFLANAGDGLAAGEFARLSAPFDERTPAQHPTTRTALAAERRGLNATPFLAYSLFAPKLGSYSLGESSWGLGSRSLRSDGRVDGCNLLGGDRFGACWEAKPWDQPNALRELSPASSRSQPEPVSIRELKHR